MAVYCDMCGRLLEILVNITYFTDFHSENSIIQQQDLTDLWCAFFLSICPYYLGTYMHFKKIKP